MNNDIVFLETIAFHSITFKRSLGGAQALLATGFVVVREDLPPSSNFLLMYSS